MLAQAQVIRYVFTGVNLELPDGNGLGTFVQHTVSGLVGQVQEVTVSLDITGTWSGDLYATALVTANGLRLPFEGEAGRLYQLEAATVLPAITWVLVQTVTPLAGAVGEFTVPIDPAQPAVFYRIVGLP